MSEKIYYYLKLEQDYFNNKAIKTMRKLPSGAEMTIVYLKMQLRYLSSKGTIIYDGMLPTIEEEIALEIDEEPNIVKLTLNALLKWGLIELVNENEFYMLECQSRIGTKTDSALRVAKYREKQKLLDDTTEVKTSTAKSNALRQRQHRAKKNCEEKQHIPYTDDYMNNKRYNGNYYVVIQRDKYKCAICGSIENLCVHHIDGYDENKPQNNASNKMITLCRCCHSNIHAGTPIDEDILNSIGYYDESNEMLPGNTDVTKSNAILELELDKELDIEKKKKIIKEKESKKPYGEFQNVFLTDDEYEKLKEKFGDKVEDKIENLSIGIESKKYKYSSHYATILSWDRKEKRDNQKTNDNKNNKSKTDEDYARGNVQW